MKIVRLGVSLLLLLSMTGVSALAAADDRNSVISMEVAPAYVVTIPAKTTVTDFGETELAGSLEVTGKLEFDDQVEILVSSAHDFRMVEESGGENSIAYRLTGNNQADTPVYYFSASQMGENKKVKLYVEQSDWNSAPPGTYSDVLIFQTRVVTVQ